MGAMGVAAMTLLWAGWSTSRVEARATGQVMTVGKLQGHGTHHKSHGRVAVVEYPRRSELDLNLHRFPTHQGSTFVIWLVDAEGQARLGGAFPRSFLDGDGSVVVPGGEHGSKRAREATRITITVMGFAQFKRVARGAQAQGFGHPADIRGERVARADMLPCPGGVCPPLP